MRATIEAVTSTAVMSISPLPRRSRELIVSLLPIPLAMLAAALLLLN